MATDQPAPTAYSQLTPKQQAFVDALCLEPNISATKAAEQAGYAKKSAFVEGSRLLRNAKVRRALGELLKDVAPTKEELGARWDRIARATLDDFFTKRKVKVENKIRQPLAEAIAEEEATYQFEAKVAARQQLSEKEAGNFALLQQGRRNRIIRLQVELEENPAAFRVVNGPEKFEEVLELDLVKAQKAGVLDLAKAIKPTRNGLAIELRDSDGALDKLARMVGAYELDNEQSRTVVTGLRAVIRRKEGPANG